MESEIDGGLGSPDADTVIDGRDCDLNSLDGIEMTLPRLPMDSLPLDPDDTDDREDTD